jgi:hypothetical protein
MKILVSTAYWPNLEYFSQLAKAEEIVIEQYDHYEKQSYRNRCEILSANGPLSLSIPVSKDLTKTYVKDVRISYLEKWQHQHWKAITSAYKKSPYFDFFERDIQTFYESETESLLAYNTAQLHFLLKCFRLKKKISFTSEYHMTPPELIDLRAKYHPKEKKQNLLPSYYQTFGMKFGFVPHLSILDLLFNRGLSSLDHLTEIPAIS